jgi:hypothetical protein
MKTIFFCSLLLATFISSCMNDSVRTPSSMAELKPYDYGALVIIQGATSESETTFNVLVPRLKAKTFAHTFMIKNTESLKTSLTSILSHIHNVSL